MRRRSSLLKLRVAEALILGAFTLVGAFAVRSYFWPHEIIDRFGAGDHRYGLAFVDSRGRPLAEPQGPVKMMLDPLTFVRLAPNQHLGYLNTDENGDRVTTGQPAHAPVAVVLGGSAAQGWGIDSDSDTLASELQRLLPRWKWVNMGVCGFFSGEELAQVVFRADDLHPALYLDFTGFNDYYVSTFWDPLVAPGRNHVFQHQIEEHFAALAHLPTIARAWTGPDEESAEVVRARIATFESNVRKMADFAKAHGARYVLAVQPAFSPVRGPAQATPDRYRSEFAPEVMRFCKREGITCIDLNQFTPEGGGGFFLPRSEVHFNKDGSEFYARAIAKSL
jgi:hypothetical protein